MTTIEQWQGGKKAGWSGTCTAGYHRLCAGYFRLESTTRVRINCKCPCH